MSIIRTRRSLLLYQMMITLLSTSVILGVTLRPADGWTTWLSSKWDQWKVSTSANSKYTSQSFSTGSSVSQFSQSDRFYQIDATLDPSSQTVSGTVHVILQHPPDTNLEFYLYPYTNKPIQITDVQMDQHSVPFHATDSQLTVPLSNQKDPVSLSIHFSTAIPAAGYRLGETNGVWSLTYWYPVLGVYQNGAWVPRPVPSSFGDPFLVDLANYEVTLTYPENWRWYTSGLLANTQTKNHLVKSVWKAEKVGSFAMVGGVNFQEQRWQTTDGVQVVVASQSEEHLTALRTLAEQAISTYTSHYGGLAHDTLSVVEMPEGTVFAHEYPNMALFARNIWNWPTGEHWIAHEIGHAWWYSSVGDYEAFNPWLDEGLTDYSAYLYTENRYGQKAYDEQIAKLRSLFEEQRSYSPREYGDLITDTGGKTDQPYSAFHNEKDYYYLEYLRPVLMFHDLRTLMGDDRFFAWLQQFYIKNRLKTVTRSNLETSLSDVDPRYLARLRFWLDTPNDQLVEWMKGQAH